MTFLAPQLQLHSWQLPLCHRQGVTELPAPTQGVGSSCGQTHLGLQAGSHGAGWRHGVSVVEAGTMSAVASTFSPRARRARAL